MDKIFSHFIARGDDDMQRLAYASWLVDVIPESEFVAEDLLFWHYIHYSEKLNVPIVRKYFELWLHTELRKIMRTTNARVIGCESLRFDDPLSFETAAKTTTRVMLDNFTQLETMSSDLDDFKIEIATFFSSKRAQRLTEALSGTYETLNNTDDSITASDFALDTINNINEIYDVEKLEDLGVAGESRKMEFVTDSCLLYTSPSPRDISGSRIPSSA